MTGSSASATSHILTSVVPRLIALAVALVVTGAPVVTTVCEGVCAARDKASVTTGEHHSCHQAPTAKEAGITSAAHICGHADEGPSAVGQSLWSLAVPAVPVAAFTLTPPSVEAAHAGRQSDHSPPLISPRSTQLRI
jgi:hypothetical protein